MKKKLVNDAFEFLELYIIIQLRKRSTLKQREIREAQEEYKLYKTLNPRYSETLIPLNLAKLKIDSSDIIYSSNYNIFRSW